MVTGFILLGLSFLFFPLIFISPYKFCALNSLGTCTLFASIIFMKGSSILKKLFGKKMILFTLMFLISLICEIYYSVINEQYIMVLIFLAMQTLSILYLVLSNVPNGVSFLNSMIKKFGGVFLNLIKSCFKKS